MSESDDIQEFVKLVGKGKKKGVPFPVSRDDRVDHTTYSLPADGYTKWCTEKFPNIKYFFDPDTGMFGVHDASDPLKTDMSKRIADAWDAYARSKR